MYISAIYIASALLILICSLTVFLQDDNHNTSFNAHMGYLESTIYRNKVKYILLYTTFFQKEYWGPKTLSHCPVSNCLITRNSQEVITTSEFDAIIFHYRDLEMVRKRSLM